MLIQNLRGVRGVWEIRAAPKINTRTDVQIKDGKFSKKYDKEFYFKYTVKIQQKVYF